MPFRPLQPFRKDPHLDTIQLCCSARRDPSGVLLLHYRLSGALQPILLPAAVAEPRRRDGLWQSTCFEAFLGSPGRPNYWELNLAPSGDWNLYALSGYRSGLQAETRVLQLDVRRTAEPEDDSGSGGPLRPQRLDLELCLDLAALLPAEQALELSITAVLEHQSMGCSYWAWSHTGADPDFHRRDSFQTL